MEMFKDTNEMRIFAGTVEKVVNLLYDQNRHMRYVEDNKWKNYESIIIKHKKGIKIYPPTDFGDRVKPNDCMPRDYIRLSHVDGIVITGDVRTKQGGFEKEELCKMEYLWIPKYKFEISKLLKSSRLVSRDEYVYINSEGEIREIDLFDLDASKFRDDPDKIYEKRIPIDLFNRYAIRLEKYGSGS